MVDSSNTETLLSMIRNNRSRCLALVAITWFSSPLGADNAQPLPINIQADQAIVSELEGLSTYSGNVRITRGAMQINAHEVRLTSQDNTVTTIVATGRAGSKDLASFTQAPSQKLESIEASALTIEYKVSEERLILSGDATLALGQDRYRGDKLSYDVTRGIFKLESGDSPSDRVNLTINPNSDNPL